MKLKTFIELYGPDLLSKINLINDTNGVKKTHVDTIPSVIKDLDEVITLQSQASKSILSSNEPNSQNFKDTFSYQADKSIINSDKKLVIESNTDLKEWPSDSQIPKQKEMIFSNDKLSSHRFRKSQSPQEFSNEDNSKLIYSPTSQLDNTNRDQNYTETTQQHNTFMKQIIKDAGIEISDDGKKIENV